MQYNDTIEQVTTDLLCESCADEAEWAGVDALAVPGPLTDDDGRPACDVHAEPGAMFAL